MVPLLLLALSLFSPCAHGQTYSPPSHSPQTYTPQTYSPQGYSPPGYTPQTNTGEAQNRPPLRTRRFKCLADDTDDSCTFYSARDLRSGNPCTCNGNQGSIY
jgi:hypothetical protein